jgi:hypothetical protein
MDAKECRHCRQPIHPQARICQHCKGNQSWFAGQTDPRFQAMILGGILLILVPLVIWLPDLIFSSAEPRGAPKLVVTGTSVRYTDTPEGTRVFVLGQVRNESRIEAARIWLRLELFDASDRVLDTLLQEQSGLVVAGSASRPFRVTGLVGAPPKDVKRVAVTVERARERGKYD